MRVPVARPVITVAAEGGPARGYARITVRRPLGPAQGVARLVQMDFIDGTLVSRWRWPIWHEMGNPQHRGEGSYGMTVADAIHDYRERCLPHLIRLRMLSTEQSPGPSAGVAAEVGRATGAVLTQAQAASRVALAGSRDRRSDQGPGAFLGARLARLRTAAEDAVSAARSGNAAALRQRLVRFDALTSAIWTAQDAAHDWAVPPARAEGHVA